MKIGVAVKNSFDYRFNPFLNRDGLSINKQYTKMIINPFDAVAIEQAVSCYESGVAQEVIAVTVGEKSDQSVLDTACARGATSGVLIETFDQSSLLTPLMVSRVLASWAKEAGVDLLLMGKQSIDYASGQVGAMVAGFLTWPQALGVIKFNKVEENKVQVVQPMKTGLQTLDLRLPAVVTVDITLTKPRHIGLKELYTAYTKPFTIKKQDEIVANVSPKIKTTQLKVKSNQKNCHYFSSVEDLMVKLKQVDCF